MAFFRWVLLLAALAVTGARAQSVIAYLPVGDMRAVAVNPATNRVYAVNEFANSVAVIDGATHAVTNVAVGRRPQFVGVNTATNRIYVSNAQDASLSVIDGATLAVSTLAINGSGPILVDEAINRVYVMRLGNADEVTYVNGADNSWYTIATDSFSPVAMALNPNTRRLYVAHHATGDVRSIDTTSTSDHPPSVSISVWSKPVAVAVNPSTNRVYALSDDARGPISVIDGSSNAPRFLTPAGHAAAPALRALAVNPNTNKVYAGFAAEVIVVDGASDAMTFIPSGPVAALKVNTTANKAYAVSNGALVAIDGVTNAAATVAIVGAGRDLAINPVTNRIYAATSSGVAVIEGAGAAGPPPPPPPPPPESYGINVQGLWWASPPGSESGWGINVAHQGNTLFATWFTYDANGQPVWLVMSSGVRNGENSYVGELHRTTGPPLGAFDPSKVATIRVGAATLSFADASNGNLTAVVDGASISKKLTRQLYASPQPTCAHGGAAGAQPNYQDLWWRSPPGSESGWGVNIAHQGDVLFVTWFTYGADGKGTWLVGSDVRKTGNATYAGTLYKAFGPPLDLSPWDPSRVTRMPAGNVAFTFGDAANGVMTATVEGATTTKPITRQVFSAPATVCR